jgi:site-specific DNA-methyltransferase (adenine-specific)
MPKINLILGDCLEQMKKLKSNSVDSICCDPPYGISFMAKKWDYDVPSVEVWKEAMRVLKPGGHALIACGTRTQHRMVVNIEDAGFEIRDVVSWIYGSGFPKSLNISKALDKAAGAEREVVGSKLGQAGYSMKANDTDSHNRGAYGKFTDAESECNITAPATDEAKQWDGWGTALKPACEFFTLCRKPLSEKTIAKNVLKWGTGGINIDGCRVEKQDGDRTEYGVNGIERKNSNNVYGTQSGKIEFDGTQGRFPANLIHDGSQEVLDLFPETAGGGASTAPKDCTFFAGKKGHDKVGRKTSKGSAARFFYCPKASKKDRNEGNNHPTVKPTALMAYLCRLITPTGGTVLDPYMGSGSTGKAAVSEGFSFTGIELDPDYYEICKARIPTT